MSGRFDVDRRTVLESTGALVVAGVLAGCGSDGDDGAGGDDGGGGDGGGGGVGGGETTGGDRDGGDTEEAADGGETSDEETTTDGSGDASTGVESYLSATSNFDGLADRTGESATTVDVGVRANGGNFGFGPPAIRIDTGTTVTWEWTGDGSHNVVHEGGNFESEQTGEAGFTFEHAFEEPGTYRYYCRPHEGLGMKGAVVVVE